MRWSTAQRSAQLLGFNLFAFQKLVQDFVVVSAMVPPKLSMKAFRLSFEFAGISSVTYSAPWCRLAQTIAFILINDQRP